MGTPGTGSSDFADAFEDASPAFDRLHIPWWEPVSRAGVVISQPQPGERVLDACCGTGASALPAARLVGPTGYVHGVDLAGREVAADARRARAEHLS
ncbi:class I SAM-dependent methyltransferase [Kocuria sabuli]|uniref:class I SAM-dependent methyltransferase n=1 Tax=Kocuria sabuli TaxID=3071448 RepID=UPI0034DA4700